MANILNLDELKVTRSVVFGGKERVLRSMTVKQFIEADEFDAKFSAASGAASQTALLVDKVLEYLDDTTIDELQSLDMTQLMALLAFIRGSDVQKKAEEVAEGAVGETAAV